MALLFRESFDWGGYADILAKWSGKFGGDGGAIVAGGGHASNCLRTGGGAPPTFNHITGGLVRSLTPGDNKFVFGLRYKTDTLSQLLDQQRLWFVRRAGATQISLRTQSDGSFLLYRGDSSAVLNTSGPVMSTGSFNYLEGEVFIHPTAGYYNFFFDGSPLMSGSGVNTAQTGVAGWNEVYLSQIHHNGSGTYYQYFDDVYFADGTGPDFNAPSQSDISWYFLPAAGVGPSTVFTPSVGGVNYQNVSEVPANGDTSYNETLLVGAKDLFEMPNLPVVGATIRAVGPQTLIRKSTVGSASNVNILKIGGIEYASPEQAVLDTYRMLMSNITRNPVDGLTAWDEATFNAMFAGYGKSK